jgi:nucleoside-diphosphate-sugar epimerase
MRQRILVLGANGFIGRKLVDALSKTDWATPIAGVRDSLRAPAQGVEYLIVDAADEAAVARALEGVDAVVNCVAGKMTTISQGARALFAAASRSTAMPRVVHLSTMSVYGNASGTIDEAAPLRADLGAYSAAKIAAEHWAAGYPNRVILRPGCVYGPESPQWSIRIGDFLVARRLGDLGANGDGYCNLVHVDDLIAAIIACLTPAMTLLGSAIFNLSTPIPPTWNEYLRLYGRALRAVPIRRISQRRLRLESKLLAPPLKILESALGAAHLPASRLPPAMPPSLLRLMQQEIRLDVSRAQQILGVRWTSLDAGIDETARWYLREHPGRGES